MVRATTLVRARHQGRCPAVAVRSPDHHDDGVPVHPGAGRRVHRRLQHAPALRSRRRSRIPPSDRPATRRDPLTRSRRATTGRPSRLDTLVTRRSPCLPRRGVHRGTEGSPTGWDADGIVQRAAVDDTAANHPPARASPACSTRTPGAARRHPDEPAPIDPQRPRRRSRRSREDRPVAFRAKQEQDEPLDRAAAERPGSSGARQPRRWEPIELLVILTRDPGGDTRAGPDADARS